jgi:uncharacterized protein YjiS (DUF1127 family)|tara:strand:+ start:428 stop:799 length:372 start_codon:yes stop_codon:yes gene_type:complete
MQMLHSGIENLAIVHAQQIPILLSTPTQTATNKSCLNNDEDAVPKGQVNMTYFTDTASNATLIERLMASVSTAFAAAATRQANRRVYSTTLNELSALSNRDLADLGIARSEVRRIAWEAAYAQ